MIAPIMHIRIIRMLVIVKCGSPKIKNRIRNDAIVAMWWIPSTFNERILPIRMAMNMQAASVLIDEAYAVNAPHIIPSRTALKMLDFSSYSSSESFMKKPLIIYDAARIILNKISSPLF